MVHIDQFTDILKKQHPEMYMSWIHAVWIKMDIQELEIYAIRGGRNSLFSNSAMDPCYIHIESNRDINEIGDLLQTIGYVGGRAEWMDNSDSERLRTFYVDSVYSKKDAEECVLRKVNSIK